MLALPLSLAGGARALPRSGIAPPAAAAEGFAMARMAPSSPRLPRRALLAVPALVAAASARATDAFDDLDAKILQGMRDFGIPGAAVGVILGDREVIKAYGVADLGTQAPVGPDTVFRAASNSKTFTGTAAMRLVEAGQLSLAEPVQRYLPDFQAPPGAGPVTVRQLLNHSAGWLGYDYHGTGDDDGALARYVRDIRKLPQLTPPGAVLSYNNAAISAAGRVIEAVTDQTFEAAVQRLVLQPLGLARSAFSTAALGNADIAAPHRRDDSGKTVVDQSLFYLPRSGNPFGGVLSSVKDMVAYARFHLGDGRAADGQRVMREATLQAMRADPGPGGTLVVELDGFGVSWMVRPTAEGPKVVQHGGDLPGYHSGLMLVPERRFAMVLLTNCETGRQLIPHFFAQDWALRRFAGLGNLPAPPRTMPAAGLASYAGTYTAQQIGFDGPPAAISLNLAGADGRLSLDKGDGEPPAMLTFYRDDFVLLGDTGMRCDFLRGADGQVVWFRMGGRLLRKG
jgi:CubicO group peptidase (beta-lactamase class C family)